MSRPQSRGLKQTLPVPAPSMPEPRANSSGFAIVGDVKLYPGLLLDQQHYQPATRALEGDTT